MRVGTWIKTVLGSLAVLPAAGSFCFEVDKEVGLLRKSTFKLSFCCVRVINHVLTLPVDQDESGVRGNHDEDDEQADSFDVCMRRAGFRPFAFADEGGHRPMGLAMGHYIRMSSKDLCLVYRCPHLVEFHRWVPSGENRVSGTTLFFSDPLHEDDEVPSVRDQDDIVFHA